MMHAPAFPACKQCMRVVLLMLNMHAYVLFTFRAKHVHESQYSPKLRYGDVEKKNRLIKLFLFSLYTKSILVAL